MPKRPYPSHQRRHTAILIAALENPAQTQKQIARATGYSESQVSRIMCSEDFQMMYDILLREAAVNARSKWLERPRTAR
jgi:transcriptional regulator with XRE-family HTH domain